MHLRFSTPVTAPVSAVWDGFTRELFLALSPPFPPVRLLRFDGCKQGDEVHLELRFGLRNERWESRIVEESHSPEASLFVDEGTRLPFFLKTWRHEHRIEATETGALIVDQIEYSAPFHMLDYLLWPTLWLQFRYRRPIYQRHFGKP
jgi:ligand-binding SRPBCC domain-containing protein